MIEVWQAEWCPHSATVRQRLTELDIAFVARQVPAERDQRDAMEDELGTRKIPVVRLDDGTVLDGDAHEIVATLSERFPEPEGAEAHRVQAEAHGL